MGRLRTSIAFFYFAFLLSNADGASIKVSKFLAGNASAGTGGSQITRVFIDDDSRTVELQSGDHISVTAMTGLASDTVTVAGATGAGEITSFAKAQLGSLSVKLSGSVNGTNPPANYGRGEILLSTAKAGWQDSVRFESDQVPPGFILLFEGNLHLSGMVTANVVGGPAVGFRDGRAETTAYVVPTGFSVTPPYGAAFAYAIDDLKHFVTDDGQVQADIPIILQSVNKQFVTRGVELQLSAKAFAASSLIDAGSVTAFFDSDFSQTLTWGGIARVTNTDTGEEITDWTVTSESGFDYSKPFAVPESSCLHLIATATVAGLALAVRHWMR